MSYLKEDLLLLLIFDISLLSVVTVSRLISSFIVLVMKKEREVQIC